MERGHFHVNDRIHMQAILMPYVSLCTATGLKTEAKDIDD